MIVNTKTNVPNKKNSSGLVINFKLGNFVEKTFNNL